MSTSLPDYTPPSHPAPVVATGANIATLIASHDQTNAAVRELAQQVADIPTPGAVIQVGGTAPVDGWWLDVPDPEDIPVTATGPTWTDDASNGGGTWTTPLQTGVTYSPAFGTATPGQSVTVTATAQAGYTLTGPDAWTHTFPSAPPVGASDTFDRDESALGGLGTSSSGHTWTDPDAAWQIITGGGRARQGKDTSNHKALVNAGLTDVTVSVDLWNYAGAANYGVLARADATAETFYHARSAAGSIQLWRFVAGTGTQLGTNQPWTSPANGDTLSLTVVENGAQTDLTVKLRGATVISISDTEAGRPSTGTYAGLRSNATIPTFDNFSADEPA